jgi:transposase
VVDWVRRFQDTGSVVPGQMDGHKPKAIFGDHQFFCGPAAILTYI